MMTIGWQIVRSPITTGTAAKLPTADAEHGKYYVKVMTKASADGEFVTKETARLKKMQDDGSVIAAKKEQFGRRLNILSSFA